MPGSKRRVNELLGRLATAEDDFLTRQFLAPVVRGGEVQVRIAGVVCRLAVEPDDFQGWGVFQPRSHTTAKLVRAAQLGERERYLELFPAVRLILVHHEDDEWLAMPAHRGDRRFRMDRLVAVRLIDEAQLFETVQARFDGGTFWYDAADSQSSPATAAWLRESLEKLSEPVALARSGLTAEQREAYALNYRRRLEAILADEQARAAAYRDWTEERLRLALEHAGARLRDYMERGDVYQIHYEVDGRRHVSTVSKHDLTVQSAGICLSGEDSKFDLQSLVSVLREAEE